MEPTAPTLPAPGELRRDRRYTVHLDAKAEAALLRLAAARGEPPGRVATLLVATGAQQLAPEVTP